MINGGTGDFWEYSLLGVLDAVGFGNINKDDWIDDGEMRLFLLLQHVPIIGFKGKPLFFQTCPLSFIVFSVSQAFSRMLSTWRPMRPMHLHLWRRPVMFKIQMFQKKIP